MFRHRLDEAGRSAKDLVNSVLMDLGSKKREVQADPQRRRCHRRQTQIGPAVETAGEFGGGVVDSSVCNCKNTICR